MDAFMQALIRHFFIVASSALAASLFVIPFAIWARDKPRISSVALAIDGVISTIPSVALYGLLMPVLAYWNKGIGTVPAVVALFLYAQLPMLRNTLVGLRTTDPAAVDAARGMGMTERQILCRIQLPLASPMIMAGVRMTVVMGVATASIAAYIGAGGLGTYITQGIANSDRRLILIGAAGTSVLALALDFALGLLQRRLERKLERS